MLIVKTPEGPAEHPDAETWTVTGDERLVLYGKDDTGAEQPSAPKVLSEYARGAWNAVRADEVPASS